MSKRIIILISLLAGSLTLAGPTNNPLQGPHGIVVNPTNGVVLYPSGFWKSNATDLAEAVEDLIDDANNTNAVQRTGDEVHGSLVFRSGLVTSNSFATNPASYGLVYSNGCGWDATRKAVVSSNYYTYGSATWTNRARVYGEYRVSLTVSNVADAGGMTWNLWAVSNGVVVASRGAASEPALGTTSNVVWEFVAGWDSIRFGGVAGGGGVVVLGANNFSVLAKPGIIVDEEPLESKGLPTTGGEIDWLTVLGEIGVYGTNLLSVIDTRAEQIVGVELADFAGDYYTASEVDLLLATVASPNLVGLSNLSAAAYAWAQTGVTAAASAQAWGTTGVVDAAKAFAWAQTGVTASAMAYAWGYTGVVDAARAYAWGTTGVVDAARAFAWAQTGLVDAARAYAWGQTGVQAAATAQATGEAAMARSTAALAAAAAAPGEYAAAYNLYPAWHITNDLPGPRLERVVTGRVVFAEAIGSTATVDLVERSWAGVDVTNYAGIIAGTAPTAWTNWGDAVLSTGAQQIVRMRNYGAACQGVTITVRGNQ